jgi:hypothetical protein
MKPLVFFITGISFLIISFVIAVISDYYYNSFGDAVHIWTHFALLMFLSYGTILVGFSAALYLDKRLQ